MTRPAHMSAPRTVKFLHDKGGVAATEFALLLPLLLMFLGVIFEVGCGWMSYQRFVTLIDNTARWSARFPAFETKVRLGTQDFVKRFSNPLNLNELDLTLRSAKLVAGVPILQYAEYNYYGNTKDMNWSKSMKDENFAEGEIAIIITGRYIYKPFFSILGNYKFEFDYSVAVNPYFSRRYDLKIGNADWDLWNVR